MKPLITSAGAGSAAIDSSAALLQCQSHPTTVALAAAETTRLLALVPGWELQDGQLCRDFRFPDFHHTMAYVNAIAYLSHTEDHHPECTFGYGHCLLRYQTHSVEDGRGGLSLNDFICAAKASVLYHAAAVRA